MNNIRARWHSIEALFADERVFQRALIIVPVFYIFLEFIAISQLSTTRLSPAELSPIWSVFWLDLVPGISEHALPLFLWIFLIGSTIGALFYKRRWARVVAFLAVLEYQGFLVTRLGSEHEFYMPLFISLLFIFLPDAWSRMAPVDDRKKFLLVVWGAQAYLMLVYFMSGLGKVFGAIEQIGQSNYFSFDSAALYTAFYLDQFQRSSLLGPTIIEYPLLGWMGLMLMLYVTLGGAAVLLRPALYPVWGFGYVLFHISTLVSMNLVFFFFPFFAALFMMLSPFAPDTFSWRNAVRELPLIGFMFRRMVRDEEVRRA